MSRCYYCCCLFCLWYYQYNCMNFVLNLWIFFSLYRIHFLIQNIVDAWWMGCCHCGFSRFNLKCQVAIFVVAVLMFNRYLHHAMPGTHNHPHPTLVYIKSKEQHIMNRQYTSLYQFKWHLFSLAIPLIASVFSIDAPSSLMFKGCCFHLTLASLVSSLSRKGN